MKTETLNKVILHNCIKNGEDLYYWDKEKEELYIYNRNLMPIEKCSPEIIKQLFNILTKEREEAFDSLIEITNKMLQVKEVNFDSQNNFHKQDT